MASPPRTICLRSSSPSSPLLIFIFCFTIHASISSNARSITAVDHAKSLQDCEQAFTSTSPCRRIIRAEFDSRTRSGTEVAASSSSSSSDDHVDYKTAQNEMQASVGASRSRVSSENSDMNDHQDFTEMDYHPPHRNSPIHNR